MMKVFIVIGAHGEYESYREEVCGIFPARSEAESAIAAAKQEREQINAVWYARRARYEAALETMTPESITAASELFGGRPFKHYRTEQYREAKRIAGNEVPSATNYDGLNIYEVEFGEWLWDLGEPVATMSEEK